MPSVLGAPNYPAGPTFGSIDNISGGGGLGVGAFPPAPSAAGGQGLGNMVGVQLGPVPQAPPPFTTGTSQAFPTAPPAAAASAPMASPAPATPSPNANLLYQTGENFLDTGTGASGGGRQYQQDAGAGNNAAGLAMINTAAAMDPSLGYTSTPQGLSSVDWAARNKWFNGLPANTGSAGSPASGASLFGLNASGAS